MTLAGRRVVVTRPQDQAEPLCAALGARGAIPVVFPVLEITPVDDRRALDEACRGLDRFDLAFFVSPNAVRHALRAILSQREWPPHVAVATVGGGSARALAEYGFEEVIAPRTGFDTEAVLALPQFAPAAVRGRKVIIFRGEGGGREVLSDYLRSHGAEVCHVATYRRACPGQSPQPLVDLARAGVLDALTITSSEGVRNLVTMLGEELAALKPVAVFAPHARIVAVAREVGFEHVYQTEAGDTGVLAALERHFTDASSS